MKIKAACIGTSDEIADALSSSKFATDVLVNVIGRCLRVENVLERPAEYYLQVADRGPSVDGNSMGVEVRISGVSRMNRTPQMFHKAIGQLVLVVANVLHIKLRKGERCQIFCVIMLDAEIETEPGSGVYSMNIESEATWVEGSM